jgi:hypothetical protein
MTQMTEIAYKYSALFPRDFGRLRRTLFHISSDMSSISSELSSREGSFFQPESSSQGESSAQEESFSQEESSFQGESPSQQSSSKGALLDQLEAAVTAQQAAFCCGGTIPIAAARDCIYEHVTVDAKPLASPPVVIRWDLPSGKAIRKLTLPAIQKAESTPAISELLESCSPATFGHGGRDVLDQSYRRAVKLDSNQFCTSFSPHDFGIMDAIAQTLLPEVTQMASGKRIELQEYCGVVAELYKLNVSRCFFALES